MKLLIALLTTLLLFSFSSFAQVKVEIIKANESTMHFEKPTLNKAVKHLKKLILAKKRFKGEWSEDQAGYIFDRETIDESVEYFIPSNFSVTVTDITAEMETIETDKVSDKNEIKRLKNKIEQLEIDSDHKKLLKRLVKSCLNE